METKAYSHWWRFEYLHWRTEQDLAPFMGLRPAGPWLKRIRLANFLSTRTVAARLNMNHAHYSRLENNEYNLSLARLRRCADALDCEMVYALVPRTLPSKKIWEATAPLVTNTPRVQKALHPDRVLAIMAREKMYDPVFRKSMGWAFNNTDKAYESARVRKIYRNFSRYTVELVPNQLDTRLKLGG